MPSLLLTPLRSRPCLTNSSNPNAAGRRARVAALSLLVVAALTVEPALADQATAAQALFDAGAAARDEGDFEKACEKFEASNQLDSTAGTALNIADCREQLGQLAQAWQRYTEAAERLPDSDPRADYAAKKAEELKPRLPRVTLVWNDPPEDLAVSVFLDGAALPSSALDVPLPVDPGEHEYLVRAAGREDAVISVEIAEGEQREVELSLGEPIEVEDPQEDLQEREEPEALSEEEDKQTNPLRTAGWVGLGVGGAGVALGAVSGLLAIGMSEKVKEDCDLEADFCRTEDGKKAADAGNAMATLSTVSFIAGGVFAAAGVTLVLLGGRDSSTMGEEASGGRDKLALTVHTNPTMTGFSLKGAF